MITALALALVLMVIFWLKWVRAMERADEVSREFAEYVAQADQRFLAVRGGRAQARPIVDDCNCPSCSSMNLPHEVD